MNWGYKILFVYLAFVAGIVFMVVKSSNQKMDLVTTDYYAKELKYQDKIDEAKRTSALSKEIACTIADDKISILFPKDFEGKNIAGDILLYCPSDEGKDVAQKFATQDLTTAISLPAKSKGLYEIHISWVVDGNNYYYQKKILI
ncbi:FixH family protein [Ferruginibacter lapsinanis]|uniref:FixH family protein n=1 Tax=Ferruginibacter lapsinanis TaxID=563172 RepID=UPI001E5960FC|nr:FixH family protein [Ferruginibacter lapsinanis]UEG50092.1 FixH family protein [Ferruginibacter lapsinanis]